MEQIELSGVKLEYINRAGIVEVLAGIDLKLRAEEFVAILGPSGCGKSTLLSLIAGMIAPTSGKVWLDGCELQGTSPRIGYMLQQDHLLEWRTIQRNAFLGLELRGLADPVHRCATVELLKRYGLGDFLHRYPAELSGGMRQRVALVRTLALSPDILLLDEPFSALDYQTRLMLEEEMATILRQAKKTAILVTHDIAEAIAMADRVLVLTSRPTRIKADYRINLTAKNGSPLATRQVPEFQEYFKKIWDDLEASDAAIL